MEFLLWLEQTGLSTWIREGDSLWAYPAVITLHSAGLAVMVGLSSVVALRILGVAPGVPLPALEKLYPIIWFGFGINAISGFALIVADPVKMVRNPLLLFKLLLIAIAVVNVVLIDRLVLRAPGARAGVVSSGARGLAIASLVLWIAATTAGRLTAYIGAQIPL